MRLRFSDDIHRACMACQCPPLKACPRNTHWRFNTRAEDRIWTCSPIPARSCWIKSWTAETVGVSAGTDLIIPSESCCSGRVLRLPCCGVTVGDWWFCGSPHCWNRVFSWSDCEDISRWMISILVLFQVYKANSRPSTVTENKYIPSF